MNDETFKDIIQMVRLKNINEDLVIYLTPDELVDLNHSLFGKIWPSDYLPIHDGDKVYNCKIEVVTDERQYAKWAILEKI